MKKRQQTSNLDAFSLFPDLMEKLGSRILSKGGSEIAKKGGGGFGNRQSKSSKSKTIPPSPPNIDWLPNGIPKNQEQANDIPTALVLMTEREGKKIVSLSFEKLGYQVEFSDTPQDAIHKVTSRNYKVIVLHEKIEGEVLLTESKIHTFMTKLSMDRRRLVFYIIVGAEFRTLYNLEALSLSANLVVNDADVESLVTIFKKSYDDYRELFEPFLESLDKYRKL